MKVRGNSVEEALSRQEYDELYHDIIILAGIPLLAGAR